MSCTHSCKDLRLASKNETRLACCIRPGLDCSCSLRCACRLLYFAVAVRRPLARFLRFALMVPVFAALFGPASQGVHGLYVTLLRVRHVGCVRILWPSLAAWLLP